MIRRIVFATAMLIVTALAFTDPATFEPTMQTEFASILQ